MSLQNMDDYVSPQLLIFCCFQQYFLIYNPTLSSWYLVFHQFEQICQLVSLTFSAVSFPFITWMIMALYSFLFFVMLSNTLYFPILLFLFGTCSSIHWHKCFKEINHYFFLFFLPSICLESIKLSKSSFLIMFSRNFSCL